MHFYASVLKKQSYLYVIILYLSLLCSFNVYLVECSKETFPIAIGRNLLQDAVADEQYHISQKNLSQDFPDVGAEHSHTDEKPTQTHSNLGFIHGFISSLSVIVVSELGDKTFFIAAIMAMKYSRMTVFSGALFALAVMTALSAFLGYATTIIPRYITYYISTALFALFGLKMLKEGLAMSADEGKEELEEVQAELKKKEEEMESESKKSLMIDEESGVVRGGGRVKVWGIISPIFLQAFTLTFLAEWGDRSQLTTIILGARENVFGVTVGGILGHAICTAIAVVGGRMIAQKISVRTVTIIGGIVFLFFALSSIYFSPEAS